MNIREHHQRVVDKLIERFGDDPRYPALIVGGSIAHGWDREDSDVDIVLVATDEEYARCQAEGNHHYFANDICDYPGGYVDGKILDMQFLCDVADHGSEPARAAFVGAFPAYSRIPELDDLLRRITAYPEQERQAKMDSFYSQILLLNWYIGEAERHNNRYLLLRMTSEMVLFGGRLILAYNRILYPYHKWFIRQLQETPEMPENFMALTQALLDNPGKDAAQAFCDCIVNYRDWGVSFGQAINHFMQDSEWNWRQGKPPLQDW